MSASDTRPKDTVFVHIGMHKTGTKSIQAALKSVTDGTTRYARLDRPNHSIALITALAQTPERHMFYTKRGLDAAAIAPLRTAARDRLTAELHSAERNLILSGEELCMLRAADVARLQAALAPACKRIRIIAYLREPVGFASSAFQQVARHGKLTDLVFPKVGYRRRFGAYLDVFGPQNVEFAAFDPARLAEGCLITDFCQRVGLDPAPRARQHRNQSLSADVVALLLDWNAHGALRPAGSPAHVQAMSPMIAQLRQSFPGTFRFDPAVMAEHIDRDDCAWIEQVAGFALPPARPAATDDVRSPADLATRARAALPGLRKMLADRGLNQDGDRPALLLDRLYHACLEEVRAP